MTRLSRFILLTVLAVAAVFSAQAASAQMMHYALDITIETEDGSAIPAGTVCINSVTGGETCQDIPADTPSGRDFLFEGLPDGEHTITVNAGDYLEAIAYADAADPAGEATVVLYMEETPPSNLPNTGAGVTDSSSNALAGVLLVGATLAAVAATGVRRTSSLRA